MSEGTVVVVGATGTLGSAISSAVRASETGRVVATTRSASRVLPREVERLQVDLLNPGDVRDALRRVGPVRSIVYSALFAPSAPPSSMEAPQRRMAVRRAGALLSWMGWVPGLTSALYTRVSRLSLASTAGRENERMFDAVLSAAEQSPHNLEHVGLVTGGKAYGMHLTPYLYPGFASTMREDDPRAPGPCFYYEQEDRLVEGARRHGYRFTISRPSYVVGFAPSRTFSLLKAIVAFAALRKAEGKTLVFPGDAAAADAVFSWCDSEQVAALHQWALHAPSAVGRVFNVSNGDPRSFRELWPVIAEALDMTPEFLADGFPVSAYVADRESRWVDLCERASLVVSPEEAWAPPDNLANLATHDWDTRYDLSRLRQAGFTRAVDSAEMFRRWIGRLRERRWSP